MDVCEGCGFDFDALTPGEVGPTSIALVDGVVTALTDGGDDVASRPTPERWSALEYGSHIRDVMLTIRDRLVIGLVEDDPEFKPLYREERVERGLYRADTAPEIVTELRAATAMFARLFEAIDPDDHDRPVQYGYPGPATRSLLWMGRQAVHEAYHHLADIRENLGQA